MRPIFCVALLLAVNAASAQEAKPNTLTPKEIADGWVLLFDGVTAYGWKGDAKMQVVDGKLAIRSSGMNKALVRHTGEFRNVEVAFDYMEVGKRRDARVFWRSNIGAEIGAPSHELTPPRVTDTNPWMTWKGRNMSVLGGDTELSFIVSPGSVLYLKNVKLRFDAGHPLFNGKDLTGWHEFPGKKSRFSVSDGAIHIKNGPGDLQTNDKYGDFVLQIECKSNGPHLNSGVFFRCRPNEYQNGYEAQIRNQFTKEPTQTYTLADYDPKTHKLLGKRKEKFTAIDYGTGAIYRRQPARKEVAKDGEWFTMTILARGNHFMTWVNGIQVTDWHDNRPPSDNARTGFRLKAGHISLQGHDPTTDLNFRNIRIAEIR